MDTVTSGFRDGFAVLADFLPRLLLFVLILVVGILVAKAVGKAISKLLERVGFDRAVERGGIKRALANSSLDTSDIVGKLIYYTLVLFVLQLAFGVFGPNPISDLLNQVIGFLPSIIVAIIIVVVAASIAAAVKSVIEGTLGGLSYGRVVANVASVFILFLGVVAALNQVGVATTVTTPVLITILATIGGVIVVGAGGGLIKPMQARWERWLQNAEDEVPRIKQEAAGSPPASQQVRDAAERHGVSQSSSAPRGGDTYAGDPYAGEPYAEDPRAGDPYVGDPQGPSGVSPEDPYDRDRERGGGQL